MGTSSFGLSGHIVHCPLRVVALKVRDGLDDSVLVPVVEVTPEGYAKYRATGGAGHQAWEDLLPLGDLYILLLMGSYSPGTESGATSKCVIHDDTTCLPASPINVKGHMQVVEIYSTSIMHQLHCLVCCSLSITFVCGRPRNSSTMY